MDGNSLKEMLRGSFNTAVGATLVLALVQPFGLDHMEKGRIIYILLMGVVIFLSGILSSFLTEKIVSLVRKEVPTYIDLLVSFLLNIPILSFCLACLSCIWFHSQPSIHLFWIFIKWISALSLFLYIWRCLAVRNESLEREIGDLKALNVQLEKMQETNMTKDGEHEETPARKCVLKGQTNVPALEIDVNKIVYIESIANYADICYVDGDNMLHKTLRITLKTVRESIGEDNPLVQCHRAFIVNLNFVIAIEKAPGGCQVQLFGMEKRIPVSRSNVSAIREKLQ